MTYKSILDNLFNINPFVKNRGLGFMNPFSSPYNFGNISFTSGPNIFGGFGNPFNSYLYPNIGNNYSSFGLGYNPNIGDSYSCFGFGYNPYNAIDRFTYSYNQPGVFNGIKPSFFNYSGSYLSLCRIEKTPQTNISTSSTGGGTLSATTSSQATSGNSSLQGNYNLSWWKSQGYNEEMGRKLADDAVKTLPPNGDPGQCVGYTRRTLNRIYGTSFQNAGAAYKFGDNILSSSQLRGKFKKITVTSDMKISDIPDGAICIWNPGTPGFTKGKAAQYGHGAIKAKGGMYSNYIEKRHMPQEIWIPV